MEKKALGRGLEALLPSRGAVEPQSSSEGIQLVPVTQIIPNRFQPRQLFEDSDLQILAESIKQNGVLQPLLVRPTGDGIFELIAGERRFRAAKLVNIEAVPVIVRNSTDHESTILALVENIQRQDLNPMEEARSYTRLMSEFHLTQEALAEKVGKDRSSIANFSRLVTLPNEIQQFIESGLLTLGHAKVILGMPGNSRRVSFAQQIVRDRWSVRDAEKFAQKQMALGEPKSTRKKPSTPKGDFFQVEEQLRQRVGTKVVIRTRRRGGEIALAYYSQDDLTRIIDVLLA